MKKRNTPKHSNREKIRRDRDPIPWRYCFLTLVCGVLLVGGFFLAARSHFASIDFGIKNSTLKKQIEELEADKRRLLLAKEIALSPAEIKRAAKKLGLGEMTASNIETFRPDGGKTERPQAIKTSAEKPKAAEKKPDPKRDEKSDKTGGQKNKPVTVKKETKEKPPAQIARK